MKKIIATLAFTLLALCGVSHAQVPKSFQANICGTVTSTSAPVCVQDGNGGNPQWGVINPTAHTFAISTTLTSLPMSTPLTGCATSGGILYNNGGVLSCSTATVVSGSVFAAATGAVGWAGRSALVSTADGNIRLTNNAGTDFGLLQIGGLTNAYPAIGRSGAALQARLADGSGFADLQMNNINANGNISLPASGILNFSTRSQILSPANGNVLLQSQAGSSFGLLQFGGLTNAFPALRRQGAGVDVVTADQSAFSTLTAGNIISNSVNLIGWTGRTFLASLADGSLRLTNNAGTDFGLLQLGGATSAFPALKRNGTTIQARLADDTGDAPFAAGTIASSGNIIVATNNILSWGALRTQISSPTDGSLLLRNNAGTDFSMLQLGGTSSSFPALKRSGATIAARVADDTADATVTAATQTLGDNTNKVATTAFVQAAVGAGTSNPNLLALAGLTGAAGKQMYFTGPGAMAMYDTTSFGRSMAGQVNGNGALATMGFSASSNYTGYVKWPNGTLMQWGTLASGSGSVTTTLSVACTGSGYPVFLTPIGTAVPTTISANVTGTTTTTFTAYKMFNDATSTGAAGQDFSYFVICN